MASFRTFGAIFLLNALINLPIFVKSSTIQRSLSDDIRNGIGIAGKILGIDSPGSITAISNIADLVMRSFSNNQNTNTNTNTNTDRGFSNRNSFDPRPTDRLESFEDVPLPSNHHQFQTHSSGTVEEPIDDNVIIGSTINTGDSSTTPSNAVDNGFFGQIMRVLGMDTSKIGALAINGIVFIAQMIGRSLMSAVTTMTNTGGGGVEIPNLGPSRQASDKENRARSVVHNTFDWIIEQSKENPFLARQIDSVLDRSLPERLVKMIDDGKDSNSNADCIKMFLCKGAPFVWGMQRAISTQISTENENDVDEDEMGKGEQNSRNDEGDSQLGVFFKYLPSVDEFKNHGDGCEQRYRSCNIFESK